MRSLAGILLTSFSGEQSGWTQLISNEVIQKEQAVEALSPL